MKETIECEMRLSPTNGKGIFAVKDIKAGTMIIQEKALWIVDFLTGYKATFTAPNRTQKQCRLNMIAAFQNRFMPNGTVDPAHFDLLELPGGFGTDAGANGAFEVDAKTLSIRLHDIWLRNGVPQPGNHTKPWAAVFKASSRLNHSCAPNAVRTVSKVDDGSVFAQIFATQDIKAGEEIFINVIDTILPTAKRQKELSGRHHITCTCPLCSRPQAETAASDERREKLANAVGLIELCHSRHAQEKSPRQSDEVYKNHRKKLNELILGPTGWQVIEKLAEKEGIDDYRLWHAITCARDAARNLHKLFLETKLLDRAIAAARTFRLGGPEMEGLMRERQAEVRKVAADLANMADFFQKM